MTRLRILLPMLWTLAACATPPTSEAPGSTREVVGPHGVVGFRSVHALFYVVPVEGGVVLVDTGFDESGEDLRRAIAGRNVLGVLVTHAHLDHWSGVATLGDVPVYAGAEDADVMRGVREHGAIVQQVLGRLWPRPRLPTDLRPVADGTVVTVAGETFEARHLPGHTAGTIVWLWRDVAFTGDAFGAPPGLSDDEHGVRVSLSRLWGIGATVLLDGHGGRTEDAKATIEQILADHEGLP
jgi:hydroxyacylglutathione hydrolase